jgi:hypothetical protein
VELMHLQRSGLVDKIESASLRDNWFKIAVDNADWITRWSKGNKDNDLKIECCLVPIKVFEDYLNIICSSLGSQR